jgi:mono/diheme cytochrome c family protein
MGTAVPSGDCNACHTQNGTAVGGIAAPPGRIALP